ncbi:hypothetical protein ACTGW9_11035, partial [Streptococcus suis]
AKLLQNVLDVQARQPMMRQDPRAERCRPADAFAGQRGLYPFGRAGEQSNERMPFVSGPQARN